MNPENPVYIISKGRWTTPYTIRELTRLGVPFHVVIEPQEREQYLTVVSEEQLYILPFSNLGQGSIPARNWVWEHALSLGAKRHWILDDNINSFRRLNNNKRILVGDGTMFKAAEDFVDRYTNVALAGFQYQGFAEQRSWHPPFVLNTRIYSTILIKNDISFRWRGRYNEDTDLSLRVLKAGWCTVLFYSFIGNKLPTMTVSGGNTEALYKLNNGQDGRLLMAQSLQAQHPDCVKITRKWGRWQHQVDYRRFKQNRLIKKKGIVIPEGVNNYGMVLVKKTST